MSIKMTKRIWRVVFGNSEHSHDVQARTILGAIRKARNRAKKKNYVVHSIGQITSAEVIAETDEDG